MSYLPYSKKAARFLAKKARVPAETEEVLAYALEVLSLNAMNVVLSLALGYLLNVPMETMTALLVVALLRFFAGGAHSNSPWRCTTVTVLLFPAIALLARRLALLNPHFIRTFWLISVTLSFVLMSILAPVDSPFAPIISPTRRRWLRIGSLIALGVLVIGMVALDCLMVDGTSLLLSITLAILWSAFILTDPGHAFFRYIDRIGVSQSARKEVAR